MEDAKKKSCFVLLITSVAALFLLPICSALLLGRPATTTTSASFRHPFVLNVCCDIEKEDCTATRQLPCKSSSSSLFKPDSIIPDKYFYEILENQRAAPRSRRRSRRDVSYLNYDLPWPIGAWGAPIEEVIVDEKDQPKSGGVYGRSNADSVTKAGGHRTKTIDQRNIRHKRDVSYLNYDLPWPIGAWGAPIEEVIVDEKDQPTSGGVYGRSNSEPETKTIATNSNVQSTSSDLPNKNRRQKRDVGFFNYDIPWPGRGGSGGGFGVPDLYELGPSSAASNRNSWTFPFAPRFTSQGITRGRSGLNLFAAAGVDPSYKSAGGELYESSFADDVEDGSNDGVSSYRYEPLAARKSSTGFGGRGVIAIDPLTGRPATLTQRRQTIEKAVNNYNQASDDDDDDEDESSKSNEVGKTSADDYVPEKTIRTYRYYDDRKDKYKVIPKITRKDLNTYSYQKKRINKHLYNIHRQHIHEHIRNHHLLEIFRHQHPVQQTEVITYIHNRRIPIEYTHNTYSNDAKVFVDVKPTKVQVTRKTLRYKPIYEPVRYVNTGQDQRKNTKSDDFYAATAAPTQQKRQQPSYVETRMEISPPAVPPALSKLDGEEEHQSSADLQQRLNGEQQQPQQFLTPSDFGMSQERLAKFLRRRRAESLLSS